MILKPLRTAVSGLISRLEGLDGRDALGAVGLALLIHGGEILQPGAGFAVAGAVMVAIAVLVR